MFSVFFWCIAKDYDSLEVDKSNLPISAGEDNVHGAVKDCKSTANSNGYFDEPV